MKNIFRKSNIFSFILGAILFSGITGVVAATMLAKDVSYSPNDATWKVDNVEDAIDDLYSKAKPKYTGATTFTPRESSQTLSTKDKILMSDITINAIPSTYKNLTTTTDVSANNLLNGVKAYTSDGTLVKGGISTDCVSGTFVANDSAFSGGQLISSGVTPNMFMIYWSDQRISYYDKSVYDDKIGFYSVNPFYELRDLSKNFRIDGNKLYFILYNSAYLNGTFKYVVCK